MLKKIFFIFTLILLTLTLASCNFSDIIGGFGNPGNGAASNEDGCKHNFVEIARTEARPMVDGEASYECSLCHETKVETIPKTRSLKVLAIGNSFSVDAVTYLYDICRSRGMTEIIIGNAQIGGCSLDTHAGNILENKPAYAYKKYSTATGGYYTEVTLDSVLEDEDWDFITLQQVSQFSGMPDSLSKLETIMDRVSEKCPDADIYWHMTWAYQQDSTHAGFKNYNNDQMTMYNAIVDTVKNNIITNPAFKGVIPSGTALQNLRTSYWGDNVTRDGYHASLGIGRFTVGLTWYAVFTGDSLEDVFWYPSNEHKAEVVWNWDLMVESAENAIKDPYKITSSQYNEFPEGYPEK